MGGEKELEHHLSTNRILKGENGLYYFSKAHLDEQYDLNRAASEPDPFGGDYDGGHEDGTGKGKRVAKIGTKAKAALAKDEAEATNAAGKVKAAKKAEGRGG